MSAMQNLLKVFPLVLPLLAAPSLAASSIPVFVQGVAFLDGTFNATGASVTFASPPLAGNTIIVGCMGDGGSTTISPSGVTDNQGNTYQQLVFQNYVGSGQPTAIYIANAVQSAGRFTVTCTGLDRTDAIDLFAVEYSGLAREDVLDGVSINSAQTGGYPRVCGPIVTSGVNDLIVGLFNNDGTDNPAGMTPSEGYSSPPCPGGTDGTCSSQNGQANQLGMMLVGVAGTPGSYIPAVVSGPSGQGSQSICVAVALRAAGE
jgi:hypothetical protein